MALEKPLVTVIVRQSREPRMLADCLESIALQTYAPIETILVHDGTASITDELNGISIKPRLKLVEVQPPRGLAASGNAGLAHARGEYISFLDDRSYLYPWHFQSLMDAIRFRTERIIYSDSVRADQAKLPYGEHNYSTVSLLLERSLDLTSETLLDYDRFPLLSVLFSKRVFESGIRFDPLLEELADWDLLVGISKTEAFFHLVDITGEYKWTPEDEQLQSLFKLTRNWSRAYIATKHSLKLQASAARSTAMNIGN